MVEFALVAPLFVMLIFVMLDGGLLLFSVNSVGNATTIGSNAVAALGTNDLTDFTAIVGMAKGGFGNTGLVTVKEVDIDGLITSSTDGFQVDPVSHQPQVAATCGGSCHNAYSVRVATNGDITVTLTNPASGSPCGYVFPSAGGPPAGACTTARFPPSVRNISEGTMSYVALTVTYTYSYFTGIARPITLTAKKTLRLEPQQPAAA